MKPLNLNSLLEAICVVIPYYDISEKRDQKLIIAMAFMLYISAGLAGYAMYINVFFLLKSVLVASLIGLCSFAFLILHDQSLLATEKRLQIIVKIGISALLAISFTLTNTTMKEYDALKAEIVENTNKRNASVTIDLNEKIDAIEAEERAIMRRIELAGEQAKVNIQPLVDARRSKEAFLETKDERIERIRTAYEAKYEEPQISDLTILVLQARKFSKGGEGTFIALILAFLFFIIESLPAILRIMLDNGDYMIRYLASLFVMRDLRDQRIAQQQNFASADSDIVRNILHMQIIDKKNELIANNFQDTEEMLILDQRQKILNAGFNPYTGQPLDYVDLSFAQNNDSNEQSQTYDSKEPNETNTANNKAPKEEPVFDL